MNAAIADSAAEDAFFRGLLDATVYAHVPIQAPPAGRIRFVQFKRPDNGELVLPFFSDLKKAEFAARGNVGIIAMEGQNFLELSVGGGVGANLMLNPNDEWLMLYPTEVRAILAGERLAHISREVIENDEQISILAPRSSIDELSSVLARQLAAEPDVEAAYVVEIHRSKGQADTLILIIAPKVSETRIVQESSHALKHAASSVQMSLLISVEPECDAAIITRGIEIYRRSSSSTT